MPRNDTDTERIIMRPTTKLLATALLATGLFTAGLAATGAARSAPTVQPMPLPASLLVQQTALLERVSAMAAQPGPVGPEAARLQTLLQAHMKDLNDVVLPPLGLLATIAADDARADMKWALPLVERARAEHGQHVQMHEQITAQLLRLYNAADPADTAQAGTLARDVAAYMLGEIEVTEPTTALVGKYLRARSVEF